MILCESENGSEVHALTMSSYYVVHICHLFRPMFKVYNGFLKTNDKNVIVPSNK